MAEGFISAEINSEVKPEPMADPVTNNNQNDIFSEIDLSDDDALDQAVRTSKPASRLAFNNEDPFDPFETPIRFDRENDALPTLSKVLGRSADFDRKTDDLDFDEMLLQTKELTDDLSPTIPDLKQTTPDFDEPSPALLDTSPAEKSSPKIKKDSKKLLQWNRVRK